jgi:exodeoxyribonuclease VII large subunit
VQDFIRILRRRDWRGRLVVLPAKVQGEGAAAEMAAMLRTAAALGIFDLLVIGRGGGSLEDLWAFNEEVLVRAVATCLLPTISAVGHEIDVTLCDFAADQRAETPSAAAELISSRFLEASERVASAARGQRDALLRRATAAAETLDHARSRLRLLSPSGLVERNFLRLDDLANRLSAVAQRGLQTNRAALMKPRTELERVSPEGRVQRESQRLLALWQRLQAASPESVLKRGFAIVRDTHGRPVVRRTALSSAQPILLQFSDGSAPARVE